jgi:hypothetical protein
VAAQIATQRGPWPKHYREFWEKQALTTNPSIPLVVRIFSLAYGRHDANGHTPFGAGDLRRTLIKSAPTAERPASLFSYRAINKAIKQAVDFGYLDAGSSQRCLIVPRGQIQYLQGDAFDPCLTCDRKFERSAAA